MESPLEYRDGGVRATAIGDPYGISDADRAAYEEPIAAGLERIRHAHEEGELGFLNLPDRDPEPIESWAASKRKGRWTDVVVVGIGGSSLGTRAALDAAAPGELDGLRPHVVENVDPTTLEETFDELPLETTLIVVVTKSGTTVETMGKFAVLYDRLIEAVGRERAASQVVAITDPESGALRRLAREEGFESFAIPLEVGGRFSVLSPVGLVPLALAGLPIDELLEGARVARDRTYAAAFEDNAVQRACADLHLLQERGISNVVMMAYSDRLSTLVDWFRQLWAESLGKAENRDGESVHTGTCPVKAVGTIDQHSQIQLYMEGPADKFVVFLGVDTYAGEVEIPDGPGLPEELSHLAGREFGEVMRAELDGTRGALREADRPTACWNFRRVTPRAVGGFFVAWELVTALMAELLEIDAYNQPGVELGKKIAHGLLGDSDHAEHAESADAADGAVPVVPPSE